MREGDRIGVVCDDDNRLHIIVNDIDKGFVDHEIPTIKYAMLDLYGRCEQLAVVPCNKIPELKTAEQNEEDVKKDVEEEKIATKESEGFPFLLLILFFFITFTFFVYYFAFLFSLSLFIISPSYFHFCC